MHPKVELFLAQHSDYRSLHSTQNKQEVKTTGRCGCEWIEGLLSVRQHSTSEVTEGQGHGDSVLRT